MLESFPDRGPIRFTKARDVGSIINATVVFIRQNARELFVGFFALVAPFAIIAGIGTALYFRRFAAIFADPTTLESDPTIIGELFGPSYFVLLLGGVLSFGMAQAAISAYVRLYRDGEVGNITVSLLWDEAKGLLLPSIGLYLLYMLVILTSGLVAIIPCLGALVWLGFIVWSFPYIHIIYASRMTESSSIGEATRRAQYLVKGSWGASAGALILAWIISFVVVLALSIPISALLSLFTLNNVDASTDPTAAFNAMAYTYAPMQIVSMCAYIVPALAAFFVHGRLVEDADGFSVDDELDIFDSGVESAPHTSWDDAPPARGSEASGDDTLLDPETTSRDPLGPADEKPGDDTPGGGFRGGQFGS